MRRTLAITVALVAWATTPAFAHRVDEYLQATTILVSRDVIRVELRMAPGIKVVPTVLALIDGNADGAISAAEEHAYIERVVRDLSLTIGGALLPLRAATWSFPDVARLNAGLGEILIEFEAKAPPGMGDRRLAFESRHQDPIAAYLVNALVPTDTAVRIISQKRNYRQSAYELSYIVGTDGARSMSFGSVFGWLLVAAGLAAAARVGLGLLESRRRQAKPIRTAAEPPVTGTSKLVSKPLSLAGRTISPATRTE
jgi:hypothetical protein